MVTTAVLSRPHGRGCGVGRTLGGGLCLGVGVGRGVEVGVAVAIGVGVGVGVAVGLGLGGGVTVAVGETVGEGVGVGGGTLGVGVGGGGVTVGLGVGVGVSGVGVGVTWGVALGVGDGVGVGTLPGASTMTPTGKPVLKKPTVAFVGLGGWSASNRKLYSVPQRIALAFWLVAKVSVLQVMERPSRATSPSHGVLLYPASPCVPSCGQPGCWGGA
jgi:hypothetical protein